MEKEFIPYTEALALKELGFDEPCFGYYFNHSEENFKEGKFDYRGELNIEYSIYKENTYYILAPTFSQAFRWFREKYDWTIKVNKIVKDTWSFTLENFTLERELFGGRFSLYEEAEQACLDKLIEIVKNK